MNGALFPFNNKKMKLFLFFICFILFKSLALEIGEKGFLKLFKKIKNPNLILIFYLFFCYY